MLYFSSVDKPPVALGPWVPHVGLPMSNNEINGPMGRSSRCQNGQFKNVLGYICHHIYTLFSHDAIIKWKHFPHYWPFVRGIHQSLVDSAKVSGAELCDFLWSMPEQTIEPTIEMPVIWDAIALIMMSLLCLYSISYCYQWLQMPLNWKINWWEYW